jgi:hypothetical protein
MYYSYLAVERTKYKRKMGAERKERKDIEDKLLIIF